MKSLDYWKKLANASDSNDLMLSIKELLHNFFKAEYVIVFVSPESPPEKVASPQDISIDFVPAYKDTELPDPVEKIVQNEGHRIVQADLISRELLDELIELGEQTGEMVLQGHDEILLSFTVGNHYIGFISMHRLEPFTSSEKRKLKTMMPFLTLAMRLAAYLSIKEDIGEFAFTYLVNKLISDYRLTPIEGFVVTRLLSGYEPEDIARERGTTIYAIRKVIRSIYKKTGVKRRGELFKLVFKTQV